MQFCFVSAGFGLSKGSRRRSPRHGVLETESRERGRRRNAIGDPPCDRLEFFLMCDIHKVLSKLRIFRFGHRPIASSPGGRGLRRHVVGKNRHADFDDPQFSAPAAVIVAQITAELCLLLG